jgi:tetratricopeptide (TPR) repeat protein
LRDRGDLDGAERLYREALRIARNLYGESHAQTAYAKGVLSILLERKGQLEEAEQLAREEIDVLREVKPFIWLEYIRLGAIRLDRGDQPEAERLLRLGLDSLSAAYPAGNPDEADALNRLAYVLTLRKAPDADRMYREAVAFDRTRKQGAPVFVSDGLHFLAQAHALRGDVAEAESAFGRAWQLYRIQLPPDHPYTVATLEGMRRLEQRR